MSFGETANIWVEFNTYEALFWFVLGAVAYVFSRSTSLVPATFVVFSVATTLLLGVTDVIEIYTGGFLHTASWLLHGKLALVLGLVVSVVWYLRLRWYV
jgi:hypothetical protein